MALLALDLGVFHRKAHVVKAKEAMGWCALWVTLAFGFGVVLYFWEGEVAALEYVTGYVIEYSLSVDNIFVFVVIFSFFKVPFELQHRVLFWGIIGALIMRGIMIGIGAALIASFWWILYLFGAFLVYTGLRLAFHKDMGVDPAKSSFVRFLRTHLPLTDGYLGKRFFVRAGGRNHATLLFLVLAVIEMTDVIFAVDSIPAIFAVTRSPFIVFTSNAFAILGLRSLYFALADMVPRFRYLKHGLAVVLVFVGVKMLLSHSVLEIPIGLSLAAVAVILTTAIVLSLARPAPPMEREITDPSATKKNQDV